MKCFYAHWIENIDRNEVGERGSVICLEKGNEMLFNDKHTHSPKYYMCMNRIRWRIKWIGAMIMASKFDASEHAMKLLPINCLQLNAGNGQKAKRKRRNTHTCNRWRATTTRFEVRERVSARCYICFFAFNSKRLVQQDIDISWKNMAF